MQNIIRKFADKFRGSPSLSAEDYEAKLKSRGMGPDGRQVPDSVPLAPPIGYRKQPSMFDIQRQMIRDHLAAYAREQEMESLEDFEDFEVGDEPHELRSGYENDDDPPLEELLAAGRQAIAEREKVGGAGGKPPAQSSSPEPPQAVPPAEPGTASSINEI